ncbi:MAG TPA: hypothetical protein VG033_09245 [Candidatus Acidoferrales bacterium]|nr:hypothetical protein [Candidatus Acidoferrales bacterium]
MKACGPAFRGVPGGVRIFQRMYTRLGCQGRPPQFQVEFHSYANLTHTIRLREDTAHVRLSDVLRAAPLPVLEAAAAILLARLYRRPVPQEVVELYRGFAYAGATRRRLLRVRRERGRRVKDHPAGSFHDLDALFTELNGQYFSGGLPRPRLAWSARGWRAQLGCFDPALRQIVINRQLDRGEVPGFVVGYVLYHEMLHLKHPMRLEHCQLKSHSPQFRREEKRFSHYDKAQRFLKRFV